MIRVIGGSRRGKKLLTLSGAETRPTLGRVRESLMNILAPRLYGARVLDLFAGSGAFAIECLSRGADSAVLCDSSPDAVKIIRKNLTECGFSAPVQCADFRDCLRRLSGGFDIIYLDPPYAEGYVSPAAKLIAERKLLSPGGVLVCEAEKGSLPDTLFGGLRFFDTRRYGSAELGFAENTEED